MMNHLWRSGAAASLLLIFGLSCGDVEAQRGEQRAALRRSKAAAQTLVNPLLPAGADPWSIYHEGFYFYMHTTGRNLTIWKTRDLAELSKAERKVVWTPPATGPTQRTSGRLSFIA
ncbi:MAG: hypothetical protein WKF30_12935 [Pyrinomonadaceae bacterium]